MHNGRVAPQRLRRLYREQRDAITAEQLGKQIGAVSGRPDQTPEDVKTILRTLRWTRVPGEIKRRLCWNITSFHDANFQSFCYKLLLGCLPTLERQRAWYPDVYDRPELYLCARCKQAPETTEHMVECADPAETEAWFKYNYRALQPRGTELVDVDVLRPWDTLGLLQGRVHPDWKRKITELRQSRQRVLSTASIVKQTLYASLETWYYAIWLPRCKLTIRQERDQGLYQGTKIRWMRMRARSRRTGETPSPTPNLPRSFLTGAERRDAYHRFLSQLMSGTARH